MPNARGHDLWRGNVRLSLPTRLALAAVLTAGAWSSLAAELFVSVSAAAPGDGSPGKPFPAIASALKAARPGDTITIRQGVYRESVSLAVSGTPGQPTRLRAAPGERVILSGFVPIEGWQPEKDGLYTAVVSGPVAELYVGLNPQPAACWPGPSLPMRYLSEPKPADGTFRDRAGLDAPVLKAVAADPKSLRAFLYLARGNTFSTIPLAGLEPAANRLLAGKSRALAQVEGKSDRYQLVNHPLFIANPGEWAAEVLPDNRTRVYFRPRRPDDLLRTRHRGTGQRLLYVGRSGSVVSNICLEGLEVAGSPGKGIEIISAANVEVTRCLLYHNRDHGLFLRRSSDARIRGNVVVANENGVSVISSKNVTVEHNEIALNLVDGLVLAGNVSGKPQGEPESQDLLVRRNYIHHHLLLGHPDNIQTYRGVRRVAFLDNALLWGGQGIMTEETDGVTVSNCVVAGTGAIAVIMGHNNSDNWEISHSTVGLGGWGAFSFTGKNYRLFDSIIWENPLNLAESLTADFNLLARHQPTEPIYLVTKPRWKRLATPEEAAAATGQEKHSLRSQPAFRAAPLFQMPARWDDLNTPARLKLRSPAPFALGDRIEINGDGILRQVTACTGEVLEFEPPLPAPPFRDALIWNWKQAASTQLDLRLREGALGLTDGRNGGPRGATLDLAAFQRGEFDGAGRRLIPELPPEVRDALPHPNAVVIPRQGSF